MLAGPENLQCVMTDIQQLSRRERMEEFMYLGLRMTDGVSAEHFLHDFGIPIREVYGGILDEMTVKGLMDVEGGGEQERFFLTERGFDVSNVVMAQFLLT